MVNVVIDLQEHDKKLISDLKTFAENNPLDPMEMIVKYAEDREGFFKIMDRQTITLVNCQITYSQELQKIGLIDHISISNLESNQKSPSRMMVIGICKLFGLVDHKNPINSFNDTNLKIWREQISEDKFAINVLFLSKNNKVH